MEPVERAIRAAFSPPTTLYTLGQQSPFVFQQMDEQGIILLLGHGRHRTPLTWKCLESIPAFLRAQAGWVPAGGARKVTGELGTLDEHLKKYLKRDAARWVACLLRAAGVETVEVDPGPPLRLRAVG